MRTLAIQGTALGPDWPTGQGLHADHMPLTARLERAFAARVRELPPQTRKLMVIAVTEVILAALKAVS